MLIPAWNEGAVLDTSVRRLLALDYPRDRLRVYVVDDASTDATPDIARELETQYPGSVRHLRREHGGQGKAHTLNHGLAVLAEEDWAQAVLITDADVIFTPLSLRRMTRHLADPSIGAVTAYIREGTRDKNYLNRFIAYEYATAQAAARRSQNVAGALACLAGGAQLHTMDNITALGGAIDASTLAEDTITTFETQLNGRRVLFEGNAIALAEEPRAIEGLWKQRLRWARGNIDVTRRYRRLWFRRSPDHRLGAPMFGLLWFCLLLQPVLMIVGSVSMIGLFFLAPNLSWQVFQKLWIVNALGYTFITAMTLLLDRRTARSSWLQALLFPGLVSLLVIVWAVFPPVFNAMLGAGAGPTGGPLLHGGGAVQLRVAGRLHGGGLSGATGREDPRRFPGTGPYLSERVRGAAVRGDGRQLLGPPAGGATDLGQDREGRCPHRRRGRRREIGVGMRRAKAGGPAPDPERGTDADPVAVAGDPPPPASASARDVELHERLLAEDLRRERSLPWLELAAVALVAAVALLHVLVLTA